MLSFTCINKLKTCADKYTIANNRIAKRYVAPMYRKKEAVECTIAMQVQVLIVFSINLVF